VEPFGAGSHDEKNGISCLQADGFGDLIGIDTMRFSRQRNGC